MRLPHAVRTLCLLLQDSNSHVRNACLRHKVIDVLLPYAASARVMAALHAVATKPAGRKDLARVSAFFREAVVVDSLDDDLRASMYRLLGVISVNDHAESTPEYVATLVSLALRGKVDATVAVALIRRVSVDVLEAALGCVDAALAVSPTADPLMLHLAMRSNALAALVAQRHGPLLVGRLIATGPTRTADDTELANLSTLIHAVVLHLSPAAFDEQLAASAVATSHGAARLTLLRLVFHFIQLPGQSGVLLPRVLRSSAWPTFLELLVRMVETMLADHRRFEQRETLGASILLAIASSAPTALDERATEALRTALVAQPQLFRFECEDDAAVLEHIVALGERLGASKRALAPYATRLQFVRQDEQSRNKLKAAGLHDWTPPEAFCCPVTMEVMRDPVVASDGHTYERETLARIFATNRRSPLTRETLNTHVAIPNINLKKRIRELPDELCNAVRRPRTDAHPDDAQDRAALLQ